MTTKDELTMPGSRVRETHAATVLSIVGRDRMIPVVSSGTGFSMRGAFGWRAVAARFARGLTDENELAHLTRVDSYVAPAINVAECGDDVPRRTYLALIGGASHEAFHRLYSQQGALDAATIRAALRPALENPGIDWAKRSKLVLDLQNVIEDIAIERLGCAEYPGVRTKLADLADYIVRMEAESRAKAGDPPCTTVQAVFVTWRDVGLGYSTPTVRDNLARIASECPDGVAMLRPGGALRDVFLRSIPNVSTPEAREAAKRALIDGSALTLALEAVVLLEGAASGDGQGGQGDGQGGLDGKQGTGSPSPREGKGKGAPNAPSGGKGGQPSPGEGEGEGTDAPNGTGNGGGKGEETDAPNGGKGGEKGDQPANEGDPSDGESSGEGESRDGTNTVDGDGAGTGAGGGEGTSTATAKDFLDGHEKGGKGTLDSNSALEAGVKSDRQGEAPPPGDYTSPMPYRPYSTASDEIVEVTATRENAKSFENIKREVSKGTSYLKTRLAVLFRALENSGIEHGVRKGAALSPRTLVDSYCEMKGGSMPTRAYMDRTPQVDMSIAAALVIDESASMRDKLRETCAGAYTLMDALDSIGAKSMAVGFRTKHSYADGGYVEGCHRTHAIYYDVFKGWGESFKAAAPRLREIRAMGGTPMADGVEFALRELSTRAEGHRILFVLTDGQPDGSHRRVLLSQLRRAAEAGILVVGVGLGSGTAYVETTFPDSVYAPYLKDLPSLLVKKLETLVRTRATGSKRGRAVRAA